MKFLLYQILPVCRNPASGINIIRINFLELTLRNDGIQLKYSIYSKWKQLTHLRLCRE